MIQVAEAKKTDKSSNFNIHMKDLFPSKDYFSPFHTRIHFEDPLETVDYPEPKGYGFSKN